MHTCINDVHVHQKNIYNMKYILAVISSTNSLSQVQEPKRKLMVGFGLLDRVIASTHLTTYTLFKFCTMPLHSSLKAV